MDIVILLIILIIGMTVQIAGVLYAFSYLSNKVKLHWFVIHYLIFVIIIFIDFGVSSFVHFVIFFLYIFMYTFITNKKDFSYSLFIALYSAVVTFNWKDIIQSLASIFHLNHLTYYNIEVEGIISMFFQSIIPFLHYLTFKKLHITIIYEYRTDSFIKKTIFPISNTLLVVNAFLLSFIYFYEYDYAINHLNKAVMDTTYPTLAIAIFSITIFLVLRFQLQSFTEQKLKEEREYELSNLDLYVHNIEGMYRNLQGFRHDMRNILLTLRLAIEERDIDKVECIYNDTLSLADTKIEATSSSLVNLRFILDPSLKSLVTTKVFEAEQQGIQVDVSLMEEFSAIYIDLIDYIRIVSNLFDNAIEAAREADQPHIQFTFFEEDGLHFIIQNTFRLKPDSDIASLYDYGHSTKGDGRGTGMYNIKQLVATYPSSVVTLTTDIDDQYFSQTLITRGG